MMLDDKPTNRQTDIRIHRRGGLDLHKKIFGFQKVLTFTALELCVSKIKDGRRPWTPRPVTSPPQDKIQYSDGGYPSDFRRWKSRFLGGNYGYPVFSGKFCLSAMSVFWVLFSVFVTANGRWEMWPKGKTGFMCLVRSGEKGSNAIIYIYISFIFTFINEL